MADKPPVYFVELPNGNLFVTNSEKLYHAAAEPIEQLGPVNIGPDRDWWHIVDVPPGTMGTKAALCGYMTLDRPSIPMDTPNVHTCPDCARILMCGR